MDLTDCDGMERAKGRHQTPSAGGKWLFCSSFHIFASKMDLPSIPHLVPKYFQNGIKKRPNGQGDRGRRIGIER
jgi:hypothetical protein